MTTKEDRKRALEFYVCTSSMRLNFPDGNYPTLDPDHKPEHCIAVYCNVYAAPKSLPPGMKRGVTYKVTNWSDRGKRHAQSLCAGLREIWVERGRWDLVNAVRLKSIMD